MKINQNQFCQNDYSNAASCASNSSYSSNISNELNNFNRFGGNSSNPLLNKQSNHPNQIFFNFPLTNFNNYANFPLNGGSFNNNNNNNNMLLTSSNDQDAWSRTNASSSASSAANVSSAALAMIMMNQVSSNASSQQQQQHPGSLQGLDSNKLSIFQSLLHSASNPIQSLPRTNPNLAYSLPVPSYFTPQSSTPALPLTMNGVPESIATSIDEKKRYRPLSDETSKVLTTNHDERSKKIKPNEKGIKNTEVLNRLKTVCERCTSLKAKCIKNEETGVCQRCAKWGHPCVFLYQRKRGPMPSNSKKTSNNPRQPKVKHSPQSPSLSSVSVSSTPEFPVNAAKSESPISDSEKNESSIGQNS